VNGYVATTDYDWYTFLANRPDLQEVNFWQPSGGRGFHVLSLGEPLLFKLKKPHYVIAGFGVFARHTRIPAWLAWDSFESANGAPDFTTMRRRIERYREEPPSDSSASYEIGCLLLAEPVFFPRDLWIPQPSNWKRNVVSGAGYDLVEGEGRRIWQDCLAAASLLGRPVERQDSLTLAEPAARYGAPSMVTPRLGQGIFRVGVIDAYGRACAVSGEHSLPALEAAHIRPYATGGEHQVTNGLLLRSDIHRLFDKGYITVTPSYRVEVSKRLREDFKNGRAYYPFHGQSIQPPTNPVEAPDPRQLQWHNESVFR
jgi:putative restriction endonuclease